MNEQLTISRDERWAVATMRRSMTDVEPDPDALLAGALGRVGQDRHRRRRALSFAAAAAALLVGLGTLGVVARDASPRVAVPASAPTSSPSVHLDGRTAALYLTRLSGRTPTDYDGATDDQGLSASLSFDGHRSTLVLDPRDSTEPTETQAWDVTVRLSPASPEVIAEMHRDGVFACSGRWLQNCETSEPTAGTALTTGSAVPAAGCCAIRGDRVHVVAYQRADRVVVWAEGRADMFSLAQLSAVATSPVWDLAATPTAADAEDAAAVLPY